MIKSSDLSNLELKKYAEEHIQYEYDMLLWSARLLAFYKPEAINGAIGWTVHNGLLNTFSIHARNLVQFLYPSKNKKDRNPTDISIKNFVSETDIVEFRSPMPELLTFVNTKANKQVAHLTTDRIEYEREGKGWNFIEIATEIINIFSEIASYFPDEKISSEFRNKISKKIIDSPLIAINIQNNENNIPCGLELRILSRIEVKKS